MGGETAHGKRVEKSYHRHESLSNFNVFKGEAVRMKSSRLTLLIFLSIILAACAPQPAPANPLVGVKAPDFELDNVLGSKTTLSEYAGTPVLLFFHMAVG